MNTTLKRATEARSAGRAERPPREKLLRAVPFSLRDAAQDGEDGGDGRTFDGYAAVFRSQTRIDSWEGRFFESLAPGSMRKTFSETTPRFQFDHGTHPMVGSIPIGRVTSVAEEKDPERAPDGGAHVTARLFDNWLVQPVRDAVAAGAVDGMSFRFTVVREEWRDAAGVLLKDPEDIHERLFRSWWEDLPDDELLHRTLREVKVPELGPVVWPAYADTSASVRSGDSSRVVIDLAAVRDDTGERAKLARALFAADAVLARDSGVGDLLAERFGESATLSVAETRDEPETTVEAGSHSGQRSADEPDTTASAGDHSSPLPRGQRRIDLWVRKARDTVAGFPD